MSTLTQVMACLGCNFQEQLDKLSDHQHAIQWCPRCKEGGKYYTLVTIEKYRETKRTEELCSYIICRDCGHMGPFESFPFDFPENEDRERRCPNCRSDNGINASNLPLCTHCKKMPVLDQGEGWCRDCTAACDAEYFAEQDSHDH